jgi:hypothetical protein
MLGLGKEYVCIAIDRRIKYFQEVGLLRVENAGM